MVKDRAIYVICGLPRAKRILTDHCILVFADGYHHGGVASGFIAQKNEICGFVFTDTTNYATLNIKELADTVNWSKNPYNPRISFGKRGHSNIWMLSSEEIFSVVGDYYYEIIKTHATGDMLDSWDVSILNFKGELCLFLKYYSSKNLSAEITKNRNESFQTDQLPLPSDVPSEHIEVLYESADENIFRYRHIN